MDHGETGYSPIRLFQVIMTVLFLGLIVLFCLNFLLWLMIFLILKDVEILKFIRPSVAANIGLVISLVGLIPSIVLLVSIFSKNRRY